MNQSQAFPQAQFTLPEQYTQASLQDFIDCRRRYLLKHIYNLPWPALQSEPALENERRARLGSQFHKMAYQFFLGIPVDRLNDSIHEEVLQRWWENFLALSQGSELAGERFPEVNLSAPIGSRRLVGKIDLLLKQPNGKFSIYDWKTSIHPTPRRWLADRLQTRVYPYLLVQAGASLNNGEAVQPQQVEMVYWYAEGDQKTERFPYSAKLFRDDQVYLGRLVETITSLQPDQFPLTDQVKRCAYCQYRSLCERGQGAGLLDEQIEAPDAEEAQLIPFDFEAIGEIEY